LELKYNKKKKNDKEQTGAGKIAVVYYTLLVNKNKKKKEGKKKQQNEPVWEARGRASNAERMNLPAPPASEARVLAEPGKRRKGGAGRAT
ncbi:hypothetical protein, partial [Streptomyces sp. Mg1]|uniref:hypothetical protein n=1 Tax=Streptomyces sp. Mg1 TaxID=465541 RepID=UPI001F46FDA9